MQPIPLINAEHVVRIAGLLDTHGIPANRYLERIRYGNRVPLLDAASHRPRFQTDLPGQLAQDPGWMFEVVEWSGTSTATAAAMLANGLSADVPRSG